MIDKFSNPILITKPTLPPLEEYKKEMSEIWESAWLTNDGYFYGEFKNKLKQYLKVENIELFVNGHLALDIAIKALELKGEVITTPFTFASTTHAMVTNGLKPVFCDINENDFTIDVNKIEELITDKTSAIIPVHVYGNPCNVQKIDEIASKYDLKVIYDAAHCFGVELKGKSIADFGDISMFSFHSTKAFHSIEGGMLSFKNKDLIKKLYLLKNFGISGPESVELVGMNAKMNEFQALMGYLNLKYIDDNIEKRKKLVYKYRELLKEVDGIRYLEDIEGVKHNYSYFPIVIDKNIFGKTRDELHEKLKEYNIFTRKYFYPLITDFECYKYEYNSENTPIAKYIANRVLTLPLYSDLEIESLEKICNIIEKIRLE